VVAIINLKNLGYWEAPQQYIWKDHKHQLKHPIHGLASPINPVLPNLPRAFLTGISTVGLFACVPLTCRTLTEITPKLKLKVI